MAWNTEDLSKLGNDFSMYVLLKMFIIIFLRIFIFPGNFPRILDIHSF
jgi:hypothetical protein